MSLPNSMRKPELFVVIGLALAMGIVFWLMSRPTQTPATTTKAPYPVVTSTTATATANGVPTQAADTAPPSETISQYVATVYGIDPAVTTAQRLETVRPFTTPELLTTIKANLDAADVPGNPVKSSVTQAAPLAVTPADSEDANVSYVTFTIVFTHIDGQGKPTETFTGSRHATTWYRDSQGIWTIAADDPVL